MKGNSGRREQATKWGPGKKCFLVLVSIPKKWMRHVSYRNVSDWKSPRDGVFWPPHTLSGRKRQHRSEQGYPKIQMGTNHGLQMDADIKHVKSRGYFTCVNISVYDSRGSKYYRVMSHASIRHVNSQKVVMSYVHVSVYKRGASAAFRQSMTHTWMSHVIPMNLSVYDGGCSNNRSVCLYFIIVVFVQICSSQTACIPRIWNRTLIGPCYLCCGAFFSYARTPVSLGASASDSTGSRKIFVL